MITNNKPWYKRWWAILLFIFLGIGMINAIITEESSPNSNKPLIMKDPAEFLPTRAEIDTEFTIDETKGITLNASGFEKGSLMDTSKMEGTRGIIGITYTIFKFDSIENARIHYQQEVDNVKNNGGYREIKIDNCFAFKEDYGLDGRFITAYCLDRNILFKIYGSSSGTLRSSESAVKNAVSTINAKM